MKYSKALNYFQMEQKIDRSGCMMGPITIFKSMTVLGVPDKYIKMIMREHGVTHEQALEHLGKCHGDVVWALTDLK